MSRKLQNYLEEHLPYEVSMMQHTLQRLAQTEDKADWNAFLESFCIHARNIKMFITNDSGKGSNGVIARDFVEFGKRIPNDLTGAFQRLNEQTAHLSKNRTVEPAKKFTIKDARNVYEWLMPAMSSFLDSLDTRDKERWAAAQKDQRKLQVNFTHSSLAATNVIQVMTYTTSPPGTF